MNKDRKPNIQLFCKIVVKDKDGKVVSDREIECDSVLSNFLALLRSALTNSFQTAVSVDGVVRTQAHIGHFYSVWNNAYTVVYLPLPTLRVNAPEASAGYGIVVGTGTTPVSPTDYKLENQIPHGTGSGQLYYRAVSVGSVVVSGNVSKISMTRTLINYTSSDIVVRETGVYAGPTPTMIIRDVLSEPVTVKAMGGAIVVSYTIEI